MHRYETALNANPEFKKHVSWFNSATDGSLHATALYEYLGTYDLSASENVRTNPKVIDKLKTDTKKPKQMYTNMNLNNSLEAPTNINQIKNAKYREKKRTTQLTNNMADEILAVINMTNNHPYVQQMIHKKDIISSVICHTKDQMIDFKLFLSRHGGTVGVDRTFNLGHFFATTLDYKHPRVIKNDTKDHPIFIGPLLLHKDASYRTYYSFFAYIATEIKLGDIELRLPQNMYFGSDDEKALTKSIEDVFPSAARRLCTKHLKDNFNHYMQDKVGIHTKERQRLMDVVVGPEGLADAGTSVLFEEKSTQVVDNKGNNNEMKDHQSLCNYFEK